MTQKENDNNNVLETERLTVAVRVRPASLKVDPGISGNVIGNGIRTVTVIDKQNLLLTEPPPSEKFSDLEHHFRTGAIFHHPYPRPIKGGLNNYGPKQQQYEFDRVYDEMSTQEDVYQNTAAALVRSVLEGYYATIFAYGATSSGKTYTMVGTSTYPGIMARALDDIFCITAQKEKQIKTEVFLSYLEVYNETIRDLLRPSTGAQLELREDKDHVHVAGLSEIRTTTTTEVMELLQRGNRARTIESTAANFTSSRSHAVLLVRVTQKPTFENRELNVSSPGIIEGKLYLIDLAGSERASNTKNSGMRLREGGHINRSLLALGNCITALASGDEKYINYRDSKLTRLLKVALGGGSKTAMIAHISPGSRMYEETRNTLLYGQRARAISTRVKKFIAVPPPLDGATSYAAIQELRNEVKRLQLKLDERESQSESSPSPTRTPFPMISPRLNPSNRHFHRNKVKGQTPLFATILPQHERRELVPAKEEIIALFDEEFKLRNDLLKLDGAMLQSALDCEILRLMVLDWENLRVGRQSDTESEKTRTESTGNLGKMEIKSVMSELKEVRKEQEKLLRLRTQVEEELKRIRKRIILVEEEASEYLPDVQRVILSLLCKLQQDQVTKMSIEIEAELKRRGALLLRCLRQKALGEAIIHRQRHFLNITISGNCSTAGRDTLSSESIDGAISPFFPPLTKPARPIRNERLFHTPPQRHETIQRQTQSQRLPRIPATSRDNLPLVLQPVTTTKYTDYRRGEQYRQSRQQRSVSEEELGRLSRDRNQTQPRQVKHVHHERGQRSNSEERFILSY